MTVFKMKNLTTVTGLHMIAITALTMITALKPPTTTTILSKTNAIITLTLVEMDPGYLKLHPTAITTMKLEDTIATLIMVKATARNKMSIMMILTLRMCSKISSTEISTLAMDLLVSNGLTQTTSLMILRTALRIKPKFFVEIGRMLLPGISSKLLML